MLIDNICNIQLLICIKITYCLFFAVQEKELWYVQQNNKWVLLPKEIRWKLCKAKHGDESKIHDAHNNYTYDVKKHRRKQKGNQNAEEIICIEGKVCSFR